MVNLTSCNESLGYESNGPECASEPASSGDFVTGSADKISVLVTGALGLVAALAWNAYIQQKIKNMSDGQGFTFCGYSIKGPLFYALSVTVLAIFAGIVMQWINDALKPVVVTP